MKTITTSNKEFTVLTASEFFDYVQKKGNVRAFTTINKEITADNIEGLLKKEFYNWNSYEADNAYNIPTICWSQYPVTATSSKEIFACEKYIGGLMVKRNSREYTTVDAGLQTKAENKKCNAALSMGMHTFIIEKQNEQFEPLTITIFNY